MTVWNPFEIFVLLSIRPFPVEWTADMVYGHFHRMTCWPGGGSSVDPTELRRLAGRTGIALGILEKDQALTLVLGFLARESCARDLAFKGGTALSKTYFEGYRLSEDLDFTAVRDVSDDVSDAAPRLLDAGRRAGVRLARVERVPGGKSGRTLKIRYEDMNLHPNHVLVQLSLREGVALDSDLVEAKLGWWKKGMAFRPDELGPRMDRIGATWRRDLEPLLGQVPPFEAVAGTMRSRLRKVRAGRA